MKVHAAKLAVLGLVVVATAWPAVGAAQSVRKRQSNTAAAASTTDQSQSAQLSGETQRDLAAWRPKQVRPQLEHQDAATSTSAPLRAAWGVLQAEEGAPEKALETLNAATKLDVAAPGPFFEKGEVLYQLDRMGDAQAAWTSARDKAQAKAAASPGDAGTLYYLGAARVRLKDFAAAREALDKALAKGADPALVHYQLGLSYAFEGACQKAVDELTSVLDLDAGFAHAYYYRGLCYNKLGRKDKMINDLTKFVALAPGAPEAAKVKATLAAIS